jgi:hypothetical protein
MRQSDDSTLHIARRFKYSQNRDLNLTAARNEDGGV